MSDELPEISSSVRRSSMRSDLARNLRGLLLWIPPIAVLILTSTLVQLGVIPVWAKGPLLVGGTFWFGTLCLVNAARCGRVHCLVDGIFLPVLGVAGVLAVIGLVTIPWTEYLSILWLIVIASFVVECVIGPYPPRWRSPVT
jgi:hypothetical protein